MLVCEPKRPIDLPPSVSWGRTRTHGEVQNQATQPVMHEGPDLLAPHPVQSSGGGEPLDEATYEAEIHAQFDPLKAGAGNHVLGLYPAAAYDSPRYAHIDVESDSGITCWTRDVARVAPGHHKVWRYLYTHRFENDPFLNSMRAFHGAELFLVFGNLSKIYYTEIPYTPSADEVALANQTMDYWTRFAATGDPNSVEDRSWLPYDSKHDNIFQLDVTKRTMNEYHNDRCDYLDSLPLPGVGVPPITK